MPERLKLNRVCRYAERLQGLPLGETLRELSHRTLVALQTCVQETVCRLRGIVLPDESLGSALVEGVTLGDLPELFRSKAGPQFFFDPTQRGQRITLLQEFSPEAPMLIVAEANRVCGHIFDLLGSGPTSLGNEIDWHVDFKTGHVWNPKTFYRRIHPASCPGGYDIKVPWELSRCQHFIWLGQAYWITEDEKYAREFVAQVEDWIESNPWPWGVNWACTMDVAIRAVNWLWGYCFFKESPSLGGDFLLAFFKSMLLHGRHIFRNLENWGDFTSNHYLADLVGLIYLGILCPEFKEAQRWREFGLQELEKEMFKQVYPDGVDFEASTSYHRLVTEMFLSPVILAQLNGHEFSQPFIERLERMLEFVMYVTKPDGTVPLIGDNDNGRLHRLKVWDLQEREWEDFRYLLAIGAVLFERDDFAQAAGDQWEEAIWLFGKKALALERALDVRNLPLLWLESRAFPDAGLYFMRHEDTHVTVSAGPNGQNGNGGHAHNDKLSFELYVHGRTWIVDPGTRVYTSDYEARNHFRSTAYHNTVVVDGLEQNCFNQDNPFTLETNAAPQVSQWDTSASGAILKATYNGYARLSDPVEHTRKVCLEGHPLRLLVWDTLSATGKHHYMMSFHLSPEIRAKRLGELSVQLVSPERDSLVLSFSLERGEAQNVTWMESTSWVAPGYGMRVSAPVVSLQWSSVGQVTWRTEITRKE
jgi:uncharacterized heparinase superfamily protein